MTATEHDEAIAARHDAPDPDPIYAADVLPDHEQVRGERTWTRGDERFWGVRL